MDPVKFEDFIKVDMRVGTIKEATAHQNATRLVVMQVEVGEERPRQIVAGIREHYPAEELVGKQVIVVTNLEPREVRGILSQGMILAASDESGLALLTPNKPIKPGTKVS